MSKPILRDFPDTIETERMVLRAPRPGDGPALHAGVIESLAELRPWMPWAQEAPTLEMEEEVVRRAHADFMARTDLMLLLFHKASGELIGGSGLHHIRWQVPLFEIGYWLRTAYTGQGYMTEAVVALTEFAFGTLHARRVEITCDARNVRSAAVARRAGYTLEGILRNHQRDHVTGELRNTMLFAQTRDD